MREILFRAKFLHSKKWAYGYFVNADFDGWTNFISVAGGLGKVDSETVGKYTELQDRNGIPIFEGDIVRDTETSDVGEIYFDTDTARFVIKFEKMIVGFDNYDSSSAEIIGNIYDNPELIGGTDNG